MQSSADRWRSTFLKNGVIDGHLKDEADIENCETFEKLVKEIYELL